MNRPKNVAQLLPLTGMRFFLALWVIVFHQAMPGGYLDAWMSMLPNAVLALMRTGYIAVGVFFVLSGFILSYNYPLDKTWSRLEVSRFAVARFARIYPAYCVGLVLVSPFVIRTFAKNPSLSGAVSEVGTAALNWTLLQAWIPQTAMSWNGPGWSLSAEAFFYCCFPFVGVALWRLSSGRNLVVAGCLVWIAALIAPLTVVGLSVPGFGNAAATSYLPDANRFWSYLVKFDPLLQLPQFCAGIVCGRAYHELKINNTWLVNRGYWLYGPGIALELLVISHADSLPYPLVHNGLLLPLHSLVVLGLAFGGGMIARILSVTPLVFLGDASYSMYIVHAVVAGWFDLIAWRLFTTVASGLSTMIFYTLIVVGVSAALLKMVEEPANRVLKSWLNVLLNRMNVKESKVLRQSSGIAR